MSFIKKNSNGCHSLHIRKTEIEQISPTQWTLIQLVMESWAVWKNDIIGTDSTIGWEYSKEVTPELIKKAFSKVSDLECEIID